MSDRLSKIDLDRLEEMHGRLIPRMVLPQPVPPFSEDELRAICVMSNALPDLLAEVREARSHACGTDCGGCGMLSSLCECHEETP